MASLKGLKERADARARGELPELFKPFTTPIQGRQDVVEAIVPSGPEFSREGRQALADLFAFFIGNAAQSAGLPTDLLSQIFGGQFGGIGAGVSSGAPGVNAAKPTGRQPTTGGGGDGGVGGIEPIKGIETLLSLSAQNADPSRGAILPEVAGRPRFLEGAGTGPEPISAGAQVALAAPGIINQLKGLFGGGPSEPRPTAGGTSGGLQPIFPNVNQEQLQIFLQILQALNSQGGPGLGPEPLSTDLAEVNPATGGAIAPPSAGPAPPTSVPGSRAAAVFRGPQAVETVPVAPPPGTSAPTAVPAAVGPSAVGVGAQPVGNIVSQVPGGPTATGGAGGFEGPSGLVQATDVRGDPSPVTNVPGRGGGGGADTIGLPGTAGINQAVDPALASFLAQTQTGGPFQDFLKQFSLPTFKGPFSTPATALQRNVLGQASSEFLNADPSGSQQTAEQTLQELLSTGGRFDLSPEFEALEARSARDLEEQSAQLNELFGTLGGRFGSDIAGGQSDLRARSLENLALQRAQIGRESFESAQQRRLGALPEARQAATSRLSNLTDLFRLGEADRQIGDVGLQRMLAEFARTQGAAFPQLLQFLTAGVGEDTAVLRPV